MRFYAEAGKVKVSGRTLMEGQVRYLSYSGSEIAFTFIGKRAKICLWTDGENWDETLKGHMAVYRNDEEIPAMRFQLKEPEAIYTIFESEKEEQVTLRLVRITEAAFGKCGVKWIEIDTEQLLTPPKPKQRKIEIIGDSITCGYGVEAKDDTETFHTAQENCMKSYSMCTAKGLDAEVHLVSWSGIGIISNWVEETATAPLDDWLMPMLYQYTDASCSRDVLKQPQQEWEKWDFTAYQPDLILINLGTNDASYCKDLTQRHQSFQREYERFLDFVHVKNPQARILCMLGTMDQRLCIDVEQAVREKQAQWGADILCYQHLTEQDAREDGIGADSHPSIQTQKKTADVVIEKVKEIMNW